jgi:hypothetical protein
MTVHLGYTYLYFQHPLQLTNWQMFGALVMITFRFWGFYQSVHLSINNAVMISLKQMN